MGNNLFDLFIEFEGIYGGIIGILVGLAVLVFLWGLARYILYTDTVEGKEGAKQVMFWGIITIFIIVSVWGIINLLKEITGTEDPNTIVLPQITEHHQNLEDYT